MSNAASPLPTTLDACHATLKQLAADNAALQAVNMQQQATIDEQQAHIFPLGWIAERIKPRITGYIKADKCITRLNLCNPGTFFPRTYRVRFLS